MKDFNASPSRILPEELHEECGVFGLFNQSGTVDVTDAAYFALYAMQHRGQDGAGIATTDGRDVYFHKNIGLVSDVFSPESLKQLKGKRMVMGHVRYATASAANNVLNTQPLVMHGREGFMAIAHNGHLVNGDYLRKTLVEAGQLFHTGVDSEILMHLIARGTSDAGLEHGVAGMMKQVRGSYALVIMTPDRMVGVRDPWGIRPLALGKLEGNWMLASESCAFEATGGEYVRDVLPGEVVVIDKDGLRSVKTEPMEKNGLCIFEYVYFARTDSRLEGVDVFESRVRMGRLLAQLAPVEADLVAGVPDSALAATLGYARESGIPYGQVLQKNRYSGRTFITPAQKSRQRAVRLKLSVLAGECRGKRIVLIDDSIVRGTNSLQLVSLLRHAGAKEVHMRIASPPVTHPCHFGINTPSAAQLIGSKQDVEKTRAMIGADSLAYLDLEALKRSVADDGRGFCTACFSGKYPMEIRNTKLTMR